MKIKQLRIDEFGIFRDRTLELDPTLTVIYGPNEAGKSTLLDFIRAVLFGFSPRVRASEQLYAPACNSRSGGVISLVDQYARHIRVSRYDRSAVSANSARRRAVANGVPQVVFADGTVGGEQQLAALLGGITADLFRDLFAFGLSELQELRTLQSDELGGYLYNAGMGISGSAIIAAERKLGQRLDQLYRPRGKNQEMNQLLAQMDVLEANIRRNNEQIDLYNSLSDDLLALNERIAREEEDLRQTRSRLQWLEKCEHARDRWLRNEQISQELELLAQQTYIPDYTIAEFQTLADRAVIYREAKYSQAGVEAEQRQLEAQLQRLLRQIHPEWTRELLVQYPVSIAQRERIHEFRKRFEGLERDRELLESEFSRLREQENQTAKHLDEQAIVERTMRAELAEKFGWIKSRESAHEQAWLAQLRRMYAEWGQWQAELKHLTQRRDELAAKNMPLANRGRKLDAAALLNRFMRRMLWFAGGCTIVVPVLFVVYGQAFTAMASGLLFLGADLYFTLQMRKFRARRESQSTEYDISQRDEIRRLEAEIAKTNQQSAETQARMTSLLMEMIDPVGAAAAANKEDRIQLNEYQMPVLTEDWLDYLQRAFEERRLVQAELARVKPQTEELSRALQALQSRSEDCAARSDEWKENLANCRTAWLDWLHSVQFTDEISPEAALEAMRYAEQGMQLIEQQDRLQQKLHMMYDQIEQFEKDVFTSIGDPNSTGDPLILLQQRQAEITQQQRMQEKIEQLREEQRQWTVFIRTWAGQERVKQLVETLQTTDPLQMAEQIELLHSQVLEAETGLDSKRNERAALNSRIEQLKLGDGQAEDRQQLAELISAYQQQAAEYAAYALCYGMFKHARSVYERERQPGVFIRASSYVSEITGGRIRKVSAPLGGKQIIVERNDGEWVDTAWLSRGTAEQLYLAIRFALADEYAAKASLPLVMDDIFVNFDAQRLNNTLSVLGKITEHRQIVLFTCHEHVRNAIQQRLPNASFIDLEAN